MHLFVWVCKKAHAIQVSILTKSIGKGKPHFFSGRTTNRGLNPLTTRQKNNLNQKKITTTLGNTRKIIKKKLFSALVYIDQQKKVINNFC